MLNCGIKQLHRLCNHSSDNNIPCLNASVLVKSQNLKNHTHNSSHLPIQTKIYIGILINNHNKNKFSPTFFRNL